MIMRPFEFQLSKFQCQLLSEFSWNGIRNELIQVCLDEMHRASCVCLIRKT